MVSPRNRQSGETRHSTAVYISERLNARPSQIAIAWLLRKSPVMLPIPGTSKVKHLEENASAALIKLDDALIEELDRLSKSARAEAA